MSKFKPLGNRVLIKRAKAQTTKGGILLPDSAQEKPKEGEVVAVGPGKIDEEGKLHPLHTKIGDLVLFSSYSGTEVNQSEDDFQYLIMAEDDLLGVFEK